AWFWLSPCPGIPPPTNGCHGPAIRQLVGSPATHLSYGPLGAVAQMFVLRQPPFPRPERPTGVQNPCPKSTSQNYRCQRVVRRSCMGHLLGYARVSTTDQQPQLQVD